ncbi:hypothetical protein [Vibrio gallaecicus]|uniref:hypothetical protein n=1 Tax=Vibrio gallaecicus TaxID=552386 RepID=UPI0025B5A0FE|nr:hypothetical protein [Vibrio gallaecicus]MDN3616957.1 hypothetical protein [Vibrio gallaecicus]
MQLSCAVFKVLAEFKVLARLKIKLVNESNWLSNHSLEKHAVKNKVAKQPCG